MAPEENPSLNLSFLKEFCRDDKRKMTQYIHTFLEEVPVQIEAIKKNAVEKNWLQVRMMAHSLQPQAAFIGLTKMKSILDQIEIETPLENARTTLPALIAELEIAMENGLNALVQTLVTLA